jgi:hypothetical protein
MYTSHMRGVLFAVATALVAAVIMWVITTVITSLASPWQWFLIVLTGLLSFGGAWALGRKINSDNGSRIAVGSGIRAGRDVNVTDITINDTAPKNAEVGTNIRSKGSTRIRRVLLGKDQRKDD